MQTQTSEMVQRVYSQKLELKTVIFSEQQKPGPISTESRRETSERTASSRATHRGSSVSEDQSAQQAFYPLNINFIVRLASYPDTSFIHYSSEPLLQIQKGGVEGLLRFVSQFSFKCVVQRLYILCSFSAFANLCKQQNLSLLNIKYDWIIIIPWPFLSLLWIRPEIRSNKTKN